MDRITDTHMRRVVDNLSSEMHDAVGRPVPLEYRRGGGGALWQVRMCGGAVTLLEATTRRELYECTWAAYSVLRKANTMKEGIDNGAGTR